MQCPANSNIIILHEHNAHHQRSPLSIISNAKITEFPLDKPRFSYPLQIFSTALVKIVHKRNASVDRNELLKAKNNINIIYGH